MPSYRFKIGDAFHSDDPVARFVTVLAMIVNDWHRVMALMPTESTQDPETIGVRLMLARQEAAACFEVMKFINDSRRHFPEIESFVKGLGADAQEQLARLEAATDRRSPDYQEWLKGHRDVTSHYPELVREKHAAAEEEIANAMKQAEDEGGTVTVGETDRTLRFHYADAVAVGLLPNVVENPTLISKLSEARIAVGRFAGLAFAAYRAIHAEHFIPEP